ncbi:hypothetical protein JHK85_032699 [Glycine max]|nr:hypothetical protein JHK85_032699 [Glycine max]
MFLHAYALEIEKLNTNLVHSRSAQDFDNGTTTAGNNNNNNNNTDQTTAPPLYFSNSEKLRLPKKEGRSSTTSSPLIKNSSSSSSTQRKCAFARKCARLVKEQRARFYIMRRCVIMLICWHEYNDS